MIVVAQFIPYIHASVDNSFYYATPQRKIVIYVSPVNQRTDLIHMAVFC